MPGCTIGLSFYIFIGYVTFLSPNKKVTKEIGIGEALCAELPLVKSALSYVPLPAALGQRGAP